MGMQVIMDSVFARPGSPPIGGGKKGEFRDWTSNYEISELDIPFGLNEIYAILMVHFRRRGFFLIIIIFIFLKFSISGLFMYLIILLIHF